MEYPSTLRTHYLMHWGMPAARRQCTLLVKQGKNMKERAESVYGADNSRSGMLMGTTHSPVQSRTVECVAQGGGSRVAAVSGEGFESSWGDSRRALAVKDRGNHLEEEEGVAVSVAARKRIVIADADEFMEGDGLNFKGHMLAGSIAGMFEHAFMFPADVVKTRMQVSAQRQQPQYTSVLSALNIIMKTEGVAGLYRGVGAVVLGAIPGHAVHFGVYEAAKQSFGGSGTNSGKELSDSQNMFADMASGVSVSMFIFSFSLSLSRSLCLCLSPLSLSRSLYVYIFTNI